MDMIWVEPGRYWRGSLPDEEGRHINEERHQVTLTSGFWLGATEVTQDQFEVVMGRNPSVFTGADLPVDSVPWYDWIVFCNRLSELEDLRPAYRIEGVHVDWDRTADGYRLPTEAEWEYACRAGTTTRFYSGDEVADLENVAWFGFNSQARPHPVGLKPANRWGLHDMHGNVWEWCWDAYEQYAEKALIDPAGPGHGGRRILRGGAWQSYPRGCRAAFRQSGEPSNRREWVGARIARGPLADPGL
jgi:formylglycine-generating enzyme